MIETKSHRVIDGFFHTYSRMYSFDIKCKLIFSTMMMHLI